MKALSLWQPWASAIALGLKRYETRSWKCPTYLIGKKLAIHAAKKVDWYAFEDYQQDLGCATRADLPQGEIVCIVTLGACLQMDWPLVHAQTPQERDWGDWTAGRWAWQCDDVQRLAVPIPAKGLQGIWEWEHEQLDATLPISAYRVATRNHFQKEREDQQP